MAVRSTRSSILGVGSCDPVCHTLGGVDPRYLRHAEVRQMIPFAPRLYDVTDHKLPTASDYFARLWPDALRLAALVPDQESVRADGGRT